MILRNWGCQVGETKKNWGKFGFTFSSLAEWWKWKMLHWLTLRLCVWMWQGMMWRCGGVLCTKKYSPSNDNEEYYVPQCKMLRSRTLCWFAYFAASRVCRRLVFQPPIEYRINVEVKCYHSYNNCYILIMRMVSLLSQYHRTHCLSDHVLLAVSELQGFRD